MTLIDSVWSVRAARKFLIDLYDETFANLALQIDVTEKHQQFKIAGLLVCKLEVANKNLTSYMLLHCK